MKRRYLLSIFVFLSLAMGVNMMVAPMVARAATGASISFTGTGDPSAAICDDVNLDYTFSLTANTDDGGGVDYFAIVMVDGYGSPADVDFFGNVPGPVAFGDYTDLGLINSVGARPITIYVYDITSPGAINENTVEGFNFAKSGTLLAQDSIDPATVAPVCQSLPIVGGLPGPDQVPIPEGSVVGAFVATTPIYFAPEADAVVPSIVMEAGKTAWVYGVDASGQYYRVMLAGKLFWVPVSTMGPNYDAVWNGTPLPTTVVN